MSPGYELVQERHIILLDLHGVSGGGIYVLGALSSREWRPEFDEFYILFSWSQPLKLAIMSHGGTLFTE